MHNLKLLTKSGFTLVLYCLLILSDTSVITVDKKKKKKDFCGKKQATIRPVATFSNHFDKERSNCLKQ